MRLEAVDIFCGVGGLTTGLRQAGIKVRAGIDLDPSCRFPILSNNPGTKFLCKDVESLSADEVARYWSKRAIKILAGCAPCQPFSPYTRKDPDSVEASQWGLLDQFGRLVRETVPDIVTMENVPSLKSHKVYSRFLDTLQNGGYCVSARVVPCEEYGLPQRRRRLVVLASRLGPIRLIEPTHAADEYVTVRDVIGNLPKVRAGSRDKKDRLHRARAMTEINLRRIRAAKPGGTWRDWPVELRAPCHRKESGASFQSVYARMVWDEPSPTITTLAFNFGTGRFGHPEQDRAITLREAAILQSFPRAYKFVDRNEDVTFASVGRLIGNAVPVRLGRIIGRSIAQHVAKAT